MLRDFLEDHGLTQAKLAKDIRISPQLLNDILASRRLLTPEHCLKLGRYFGNEAEYWMRLQNHYLFRKAQREKAAEVNAIAPLHKFPKETCESLGLKPGDVIELEPRNEGGTKVWVLRPLSARTREWVGCLGSRAKKVTDHSLQAVRESIAAGRKEGA